MSDFPENKTRNTLKENRQLRGNFYEGKQTHLLAEILDIQKKILNTQKKRLTTSRLKLITLTIKFLIILWFMWSGFTQMKNFTENLFEKFMNPKNMISQLSNLGGNSDSGKSLIKNSKEFDINSALNSLNQLQGLLGK